MKKRIIFILLVLTPFILQAYTPVGSDSTIDALTWNIEWFPKNGMTTVNEVEQIISDLNVDFIGVQEISSVDTFNILLSQLPGWSGILSSHEYSSSSYQKVGLIYKEEVVTVHSYQLLFEDDWYAFPRPPMEFTISSEEGGRAFDFKLIVVHLKAFDGEDNEARRRAAIDSLKNYIDEQVLLYDEKDFILLGDFNDHIEDPPEDNVFTSMLDDTANYTFLTEPLAGIYGSYIGYNEPNLIDHVIITDDALDEYGENGSTEVLYLDNQNSNYEDDVSDHRPVFSKFAFSNGQNDYIPILELHEQFSQYEGQIVKIKGIVTIGAGIFSNSYTSVYVQDESEAGINIYYSDAVISDFERCALVEVTGELANYNGLHEIKYHSHTILAYDQPLPEPQVISAVTINDVNVHPGRLVEVSGIIESISDPPHVNMFINDESGSGKIYFDPDAGLDISEFNVGDEIKVIGVKTVYNNEGQVQPGYQPEIEKIFTSIVFKDNKLPEQAGLISNYPNPFNPETTILYTVLNPGVVELSIFNVNGKKVTEVVHQRQGRGEYRIKWNGISADGKVLASGIYYYQLKIDRQVINTKRMLLLK